MVDTTQSIVVAAPSGDIKESYLVVAKLSLDDGTTPSTKEINVAYDQFPVTFSFQGHGTGIVEIYIDGIYISIPYALSTIWGKELLLKIYKLL